MKSLSVSLATPLLLQASVTRPLRSFLPRLLRSLRRSGSYIREHPSRSTGTISLSIELHRHATADTYAILIASGLELHRSAHTALASLCAQDILPLSRSPSTLIEIRLEIRSLETIRRTPFPATLAISA